MIQHIHNKHDSGINICHFSQSEYQVNHFSDAVSEDKHLVIRSILVNHGQCGQPVNVDKLPLSGGNVQVL